MSENLGDHWDAREFELAVRLFSLAVRGRHENNRSMEVPEVPRKETVVEDTFELLFVPPIISIILFVIVPSGSDDTYRSSYLCLVSYPPRVLYSSWDSG